MITTKRLFAVCIAAALSLGALTAPASAITSMNLQKKQGMMMHRGHMMHHGRMMMHHRRMMMHHHRKMM